MVRNNKGGKHGKKMARKHVSSEMQNDGPTKARIPNQEGELIACGTKLLGNGTILVVDFSGKEYLCIIRKKFKGRGKRQNTVQRGTLLLVGLRCYENSNTANGKLPKCDLLEVYSDKEKQRLRKQCSEYNWSIFDVYGDIVSSDTVDDGVIEFTSEQPMYGDIMDMSDDSNDSFSNSNNIVDDFGNTIQSIDDEPDISIDDI